MITQPEGCVLMRSRAPEVHVACHLDHLVNVVGQALTHFRGPPHEQKVLRGGSLLFLFQLLHGHNFHPHFTPIQPFMSIS